MNVALDNELTHVIFQTLQSCLSPDKTLIDLAQQQLTVLQVRPGNDFISHNQQSNISYKINNIFLRILFHFAQFYH